MYQVTQLFQVHVMMKISLNRVVRGDGRTIWAPLCPALDIPPTRILFWLRRLVRAPTSRPHSFATWCSPLLSWYRPPFLSLVEGATFKERERIPPHEWSWLTTNCSTSLFPTRSHFRMSQWCQELRWPLSHRTPAWMFFPLLDSSQPAIHPATNSSNWLVWLLLLTWLSRPSRPVWPLTAVT